MGGRKLTSLSARPKTLTNKQEGRGNNIWPTTLDKNSQLSAHARPCLAGRYTKDADCRAAAGKVSLVSLCQGRYRSLDQGHCRVTG